LQDEIGGFLMITYIIGIIVIIILLFIVGMVMKKKYYRQVDELDARKMDLLNRPVLDELSKVKQLNMTGQTEELFEKWKNEWYQLIDYKMPKAEDFLIDAEDYIDQYRFNKASERLHTCVTFLDEIEEDINKIIFELNDLVGSEEKNRTDMDELKDRYRANKKILIARHINYGAAIDILEKHLDETFNLFSEYELRTANGDYLQAREVVLTIRQRLSDMEFYLEYIPNYLHECKIKLPKELETLRAAFVELKTMEYPIKHLNLEEEINNISKDILSALMGVEGLHIENVQEQIEEIRNKIDHFLDLLEYEVNAKNNLAKEFHFSTAQMAATMEETKQLKEEIDLVAQSYQLAPEELSTFEANEKRINNILLKFDSIKEQLEGKQVAFTSILEDLYIAKTSLDEAIAANEEWKKNLQTLRKEEIQAKETIKELQKIMTQTIRDVQKSNIPGVPEDYKQLLNDSRVALQNVMDQFTVIPLNLSEVMSLLEYANSTIMELADYTNKMVLDADLCEKIIQYGNRYRNRYDSVSRGLIEAEVAFRSYEYSRALEIAGTTIESVEPGALKRIEQNF